MQFTWEGPPNGIHVEKRFGIFRYDIEPAMGVVLWRTLTTSRNEDQSSVTVSQQPSGYRIYAVVSETDAYLKDDIRDGIVTTPFGPGVMAMVNVGGATAPPVSCTLSIRLNLSAAVPVASRSVRSTGACGERLTVNAPQPNSGYVFTGWGAPCASMGTGACHALATTTTVTVTANYAPQCTLTVSAGTGGTATIGATATSWTGDCGTKLSGTSALKATASTTPAPGYRFKRWTETPITWASGCGTSATCTPTIGSATGTPGTYRLTAGFARQCRVTGTPSTTAGGTVSGGRTVDCGTSVTLSVSQTPTQALNYRFTGWSRASCRSASTCVVPTTASQTRVEVTANFVRRPPPPPPPPTTYSLNATAGTGGSVACTTGGGTVAVNCVASFTAGTVVTITATGSRTQSDEYEFRSWGGCDSASGATCTVTMNAAKTVWARFTRHRLCTVTTVIEGGEGTITPTTTVRCGTRVTVRVTAAPGWCVGPTRTTGIIWTQGQTRTCRVAQYTFPMSYPRFANVGLYVTFRRQSGTSGQEDGASGQDAGGTVISVPTATPSATATATAAPTATATPSATPTPSPTASATSAPTPTPTAAPTPAP